MRSTRVNTIAVSTVLAATFALTGTAAQAQDVGRVVSLTPNVRQVQLPKQVCTVDAYRNQTCTNQLVTENVTDGFSVVYEFNGRLFTMFSANDPGQFVYLNSTPQQYVQTVQQYAPIYSSGYAPGFAHAGFPPVVHPPVVVVRPQGYGYSYAPRPVIVIRGGSHHGNHFGGHHGGYARGHHGGGQGHHR
jgi:hypothetical protein